LEAESNRLARAAESDAEWLQSWSLDGSAYQIGPDQLYEKPQRIWLPAGPDAELYYGREDHWYPAEDVEGWLMPDSLLSIELNGTRYLGILVRHGGTVYVSGQGAPARINQDAAVWGDLTAFAAAALLLCATRRHREKQTPRA
jgi:hypothetical protein